MEKAKLLLLALSFLAMSSCKEEPLSLEMAEEQTLMAGSAAKEHISMAESAREIADFIPPARERGRKVNNVRAFGAVGDGITDDTDAFQAAIDALPADGGTVFVPPGAYLINGDIKDADRKDVAGNSIRLRSNMHLKLSPHATLKAKPTDAYVAYVIYGYNVSDVEISGGKIVGERDEHLTTVGEYGHGIELRGCRRVTIRNMHLSNFWGDGMSIGTTWARDPGPKIRGNDIVIDDIVSTGNRRQALSIGPATNVQVWDSEFSNTHGTSPQCGIDIEPERDQYTDNVLIQNCIMRNNFNNGIMLFKRVSNVTIKHCQIEGNNKAGIFLEAPVDTYIASNEIHNNRRRGLTIKATVDGVTVVQNTFYENNGYPARPSKLEITGVSPETQDIFIRSGASGLNIGTNFYK